MSDKHFFLICYIIIVWAVYRAIILYNPVFSVLYLILAFLAISALLIYLSADYLAVLFVLIYGGAISILIMFVVMMLDLKEIEFKKSPVVLFVRYLAAILTVSFLFFFLSAIETDNAHDGGVLNDYTDWYRAAELKSNIEVIGIVFYTQYNFQFVMMGVLLFLAMVVIISLVIRKQSRAKNQILSQQLHESNEQMLKFK